MHFTPCGPHHRLSCAGMVHAAKRRSAFARIVLRTTSVTIFRSPRRQPACPALAPSSLFLGVVLDITSQRFQRAFPESPVLAHPQLVVLQRQRARPTIVDPTVNGPR